MLCQTGQKRELFMLIQYLPLYSLSTACISNAEDKKKMDYKKHSIKLNSNFRVIAQKRFFASWKLESQPSQLDAFGFF